MRRRGCGCVLLLLLLVGGVGWFLNNRRTQERLPIGGSGAPVSIEVAEGASVRSVADLLERRRVIRSAGYFVGIAAKSKIKPGVYDLPPQETPEALLKRLETGIEKPSVRQTFPEGFTIRQIARRLAADELADDTKFLSLVEKNGKTFQASFALPANLEGYLFPDTYRFDADADERTLAQRMVDNFARTLVEPNRAAIKNSRYNLHQILTIASMVEREARVAKDRTKIAGVIYNRLRIRMPLQIDATVQYARGQHKERLLFKDLRINSPYNTYRVRGLPPGPICCPGKPSFEAALAPERSNFLYYVAQGDGSHIFSRTYAEHLRNIAFVRRGGRR